MNASEGPAPAAPVARHRSRHPIWILSGIGLLFFLVVLLSGDSLVDSFFDAMSSIVTWVVVGLIGMLGVVGYRTRSFGAKAAQEVEDAAAKFHDIQDSDDQRFGLRPEMLAEVRNALPRTHAGYLFTSQWAEFRESLVLRDGRYFNTLEAGRFFANDEFESSVQAPILGGMTSSYSFIHEIPGFMTSLGMLGTFVGIAVGLGQLSDVNADNARVAGQIGGVIKGLASAFWTSIFGLSGASIVTWLNHRSESCITSAMIYFRLELDRCIPRATSEFFLEKQANASEVQSRALRDLVELQRDAKDSLHSMAQDIADGTGQMIVDRLGPLLEEVTRVVREQVDAADKRSADTFKGMAEALTGSLVDGIGESVEALGGYAKEISWSFGELTGELDGRMDDIVRKLGEGLETSTGKMTAALEQALAGVDDRMINTVSSIEEGVKRSSEQLTSSLAAATGQMSAQVSQVGQGMTEALVGASQQMATQVNAMQEKMAATMDQSGQALATRMGAIGDQMAESMDETADRLTVRVREMAQSIEESLGGVTSELATKLRGVTEPLAKSVRNLYQLGVGLEKITDKQTKLLEGYKRAADGLSKIEPMLSALEKAHTQQADMAETLSDVALEFNDARTTLSTIERTLQEQLMGAAAGLTGATTRLKQLVDGLNAWSDSTVASLERFAGMMSAAVNRTLKDYDASLDHGLRGLNNAANSIAEIAEELGDRAVRLTN